MARARTLDEASGVVRRKLGAMTDSAMRLFARLTRRLGYPALATVPVSAVMLTRLETLSATAPLEDAAQMLVRGRIDHVPIVDGGLPIGVVSREDVRVAVQVLGPHAPVAEAHRHVVVTVAPSDSLADVLAQLRETPDAVAVVVDRGEPVGLVTVEGLTAYLADPRTVA
jgi:CBS domain-containing protein